MIQFTDNAFKKIVISLAIYITSLISANTLGLKLMPFFFHTHLSVGVFSFPIIFLMTDMIGEVYGERLAKLFVLAGFVSTGLFITYSALSLSIPWSNDGAWMQKGYNQVFGISLRIAVASLTAFLVAEYQDVISFFFFRNKFGPTGFWLRSFLSNLWSQLLDSALFMVIAFAGIYPVRVLASIIVSWWLYKVAMGALYTPLSYVGIRLLKTPEKE